LELSAAADAAAGMVELTVVAVARIKDRDISLESEPVNLVVTRL